MPMHTFVNPVTSFFFFAFWRMVGYILIVAISHWRRKLNNQKSWRRGLLLIITQKKKWEGSWWGYGLSTEMIEAWFGCLFLFFQLSPFNIFMFCFGYWLQDGVSQAAREARRSGRTERDSFEVVNCCCGSVDLHNLVVCFFNTHDKCSVQLPLGG